MKSMKAPLTLLLTIVAWGSAQAAVPANCLALVQLKSDLWFASYDGRLVKRLTSDGQMKNAAALSEDGKIVAYSGGATRAVTLLSADGRVLDQVGVGADDLITSLQWNNAGILQCGEHVSPSSSLFHFLKVDTKNYQGAVLLQTPAVAGQNCQVSRNGKDTACIRGGTITVNGRDVFRVPDPFAGAVDLQKIEVAVGVTVPLEKVSGVSVTVVESSKDTIAIKVLLPDDTWQQHYLSPGEIAAVDLGDGTLYGIQPSLSSAPNTVFLAIKQSTTGGSLIESGPAWDASGKRLAFALGNGIGQETLIIVNRELGNAALDKKAMQGAIDGETLLPITGPISAVEFTSDTTINVVGAHQIYVAAIPANGKIRDWRYTITEALPKQLGVQVDSTSLSLDVLGWSCP